MAAGDEIELGDADLEPAEEPTPVTAPPAEALAVPRSVHDEKTMPRCELCGEPAYLGGEIVPTRELMERVTPEHCARGPTWIWCAKRKRFGG